MPARFEVQRAADRTTTRSSGIVTHHSFAFGSHYDAGSTGHALLVANNDDRLEAGSGYPMHPHRDVEIVTWLLSGALQHEDSAGRRGRIETGTVQVMSAGTGIEHAEWNDAGALQPARFVQMWILPDEAGRTPSYSHCPALEGDVVILASGLPAHRSETSACIGASAALHLFRLPAGRVAALPEAPHLHLFVARGAFALEGAGLLGSGDAARLTGAGGARVTAVGESDNAEMLVWEMHATR
ncbi:pirin family protein [soil metagenome]